MTIHPSAELRWFRIGVLFAGTVTCMLVLSAGCSEDKKNKTGTNAYDATPANTIAGSDAGWSDAAVPESLTATQACARYMRAVCERKNECGLANDDCGKAVANCPDALFSRGSTRDPVGTWQCAFVMRQRSCADVYLSTNPACVTPGARKAGESCIAAAQCESLACTGSTTSCGVCLQRVGKGKDCSNRATVVCERGLTCDTATNTCVEIPAKSFDDVVSTGLEAGKPCDARNVCMPGTYCKYGDNGGVCAARLAEGEPCVTSSACVEGTYCFQEGTTCRKIPGAGQRCGNDVETGNATWCTDDTYCDNIDSLNQCKPLPVAGEPCAATKLTGTPALCATSALCELSSTPPACKALAGPAEPCSADDSCQRGLLCLCPDAACSNKICGVLRDIGESCGTTGELCNAVSTCVDGLCKPNPSQELFATLCGD